MLDQFIVPQGYTVVRDSEKIGSTVSEFDMMRDNTIAIEGGVLADAWVHDVTIDHTNRRINLESI